MRRRKRCTLRSSCSRQRWATASNWRSSKSFAAMRRPHCALPCRKPRATGRTPHLHARGRSAETRRRPMPRSRPWSTGKPTRRPIRSPRSMPCAMNRTRCSNGLNVPGRTVTPASACCSTIRSCCATVTIRAMPRLRARSDCRCRLRSCSNCQQPQGRGLERACEPQHPCAACRASLCSAQPAGLPSDPRCHEFHVGVLPRLRECLLDRGGLVIAMLCAQALRQADQ